MTAATGPDTAMPPLPVYKVSQTFVITIWKVAADI